MPTESTRRDFLRTATAAGVTAMSMSAASYARVAGANERIGVGIIGCGERGRGAHMPGMHRYDKEQNAQIMAVCDVWTPVREEAAKMTKDWYGEEAKKYTSFRELIADKNVDAVMIAAPDHLHTACLTAAAEAKKDAYCEKPLANSMETLVSTVDAVKASGIVVQVGTQLRSMPSMTGARELYKTGVLGKVGRVEQQRNGTRPFWYSRLKDAKAQDVDWKEFLGPAADEPFSSDRYSGWYGYRTFCNGLIPQFGSHYIDLVHYITGASFPLSAVALGGTFTWKDEHNFDVQDETQCLWTYPEGFMVTYSTYFGNGNGSTFKIFGDQATMDLLEWEHPFITDQGAGKPDGRVKEKKMIEEVPMPDHMLDWVQCIRTRKTPNASIDAGYQHAVACLMGVRACDTGKRMIYDAEKREIREG